MLPLKFFWNIPWKTNSTILFVWVLLKVIEFYKTGTSPEVFRINFKWKSGLRGCSYGSSFPVIFSLNREKYIASSSSYAKHFPSWARLILRAVWENFLREVNVQNGLRIRFEEKWLRFVVFKYIRVWYYMDTLILCLVRVTA